MRIEVVAISPPSVKGVILKLSLYIDEKRIPNVAESDFDSRSHGDMKAAIEYAEAAAKRIIDKHEDHKANASESSES